MNLTATRTPMHNPFAGLVRSRVKSSAVFSLIIILAMFAFEAFNYGTTAYALRDLLGDLKFAGIPWSTLMALAFCGLDFAGIASLITQRNKREETKQAWYLFSAWLIAAAFNAALTWWGVSLAMATHSSTSAAVVNTRSLTTIVPVLVAIMVWIIRILIIGSLSAALEKNSRPKAVESRPQVSTTAGFPTAQRPITSAPKPYATPSPMHASASRGNPVPAYRPRPAVGSSNQPNAFMEAEQGKIQYRDL